MSNVISFKDVSLNFGGVQALKNISFDIQENSLFAIIGPNGAGKTSILNCINGIYKPTSGSIEIFGEDTSNLEPDEIANAGVSRTFQNIELFENMTALDNILIGAHRHINYGPVQGLFFSKKAIPSWVASAPKDKPATANQEHANSLMRSDGFIKRPFLQRRFIATKVT